MWVKSVVNYWFSAVYPLFFKVTDYLLGAPLDLTSLHLTFLRFHILNQGGSGVKRVQRNSIYNINIIYTISLTPTTIHFKNVRM